jgi:Acetyltransferase (GNAT) domain
MGPFTCVCALMLFVPRNVIANPSQDAIVPVYMQDWFTEIAARGAKTRRVAVTANGKLLGDLTVSLERNGLGMKQAYNLPWARLGGPNISKGIDEKRRARITRQLIRQLPSNVSFFLKLTNESDFKLFLEEGFKPYSENNYFIPPAALPTLHASFSKMTKRHIKQAQRDMVVSTVAPDAFIEIYAADLARRRRKPYAPLAIARDILAEGQRQGQARIFAAKRRDSGEIDAAIACLWDDARYYYWMTTRRLQTSNHDKPHQGAVKLLLWSAIQMPPREDSHLISMARASTSRRASVGRPDYTAEWARNAAFATRSRAKQRSSASSVAFVRSSSARSGPPSASS